ncbi:hypothetical protein [Paenibacillus xylanexedens]|uniref:hypothetical protein n=1 Tax=Paenibacillus xylanexedens TaxID=528191 RepID=UPI00119D584E|nr:hypothetical protein [Paenibacillus xylanexedens]
MYAIDPQAGTHFIGKIFVTPHACDRAVAEMTARINEIDSELKTLEREILQVQREKTNVMKSVVAYV